MQALIMRRSLCLNGFPKFRAPFALQNRLNAVSSGDGGDNFKEKTRPSRSLTRTRSLHHPKTRATNLPKPAAGDETGVLGVLFDVQRAIRVLGDQIGSVDKKVVDVQQQVVGVQQQVVGVEQQVVGVQQQVVGVEQKVVEQVVAVQQQVSALDTKVELGHSRAERFVVEHLAAVMRADESSPAFLKHLDGGSLLLDLRPYGSGCNWLSLNDPALFVRHFYPCFFEDVLHGLDPRSPTQSIIVGSPGIGKSAFGSYAVYRVLRGSTTTRLLYHYEKIGAAYLYTRESTADKAWSVVKVDSARVNSNLTDGTVYIVDGARPATDVSKHIPILLITSPRYHVYREFAKSPGVRLLYFGVWTRPEMELLHQNCFKNQAWDAAEKRLMKWGGIPRNVFTHATEESMGWQVEVENALASTDPRVLQDVIRLEHVSDGKTLSNRVFLIHTRSQLPGGENLKPDEIRFYQFGKIAICSDWAADYIVRSYVLSKEFDARQLLAQTCSLGGDAGKVGGLIAEHLTHQALRRGGKFVVRRLEKKGKSDRTVSSSSPQPASESELPTVSLADFRQHYSGLAAGAVKKPAALPGTFLLSVPAMRVDGLSASGPQRFKSVSAIRNDPDCNMVQLPESKTCCAIDLLLGLVPCNVTLQSSHSIPLTDERQTDPHSGLLGVCQHLSSFRVSKPDSKDKSSFPFIWITPVERSEEFKTPRSFKKAGRVAQNDEINVDQFVLSLPGIAFDQYYRIKPVSL